jgi:hypothetical protein
MAGGGPSLNRLFKAWRVNLLAPKARFMPSVNVLLYALRQLFTGSFSRRQLH